MRNRRVDRELSVVNLAAEETPAEASVEEAAVEEAVVEEAAVEEAAAEEAAVEEAAAAAEEPGMCMSSTCSFSDGLCRFSTLQPT